MIAWIVGAGRIPYVVATFDDPQAADTYLTALPASVRDRAELRMRQDLEHPCFVVEDRSGFQFLHEREVVEYCRRALEEGQPDAEGQYAILYTLQTPHLPRVPGRDEMGSLPHAHLVYDSLQRIVQAGLTEWKQTE